jgi:hypothetical protein
MKRAPDDTLQEFSTRFMRVYNSILTEVESPPGVAQLRYVDCFDNDFTLLLRERISTNLDTIMIDVIKVDINLMASGKIKHSFNRGRRKPQGDTHPLTS